MSESRHIFLSYRSSEVDFALRLAADLKNAGVNLWMDRLDINPGDDWRKSLESAVYSSAAVISILSAGYVTSKYCKRELARADRLGRPIFPVLLDMIHETDWPLEIERQQYIDFSCWQDDEVVYQEKVNTLVDILKEKFAGQISVVPDLETQYLTNLVAELETQYGFSEYLESSTDADKLLNRDMIRPEPHNARLWLGQRMFELHVVTPVDDQEFSWQEPFQRRRIVKDIYDALAKHQQIVLIGAPDSGKTTMLQHLVLDAVYAYQATTDAPIPFFLDLIGWDDDTTFEAFVRSNWPLDSDPIKLLTQGRLALYLDGLNELWGDKLDKVRALRNWLSSHKDTGQIVITCREKSYDSDLELGLPIIQIGPLDRGNIESFAINYLGEDIAPILLSQLLPHNNWEEDYKHFLYELAKDPVLLSALIIVYKSSAFGYTPENLGMLLKAAVLEIWAREQQGEPTTDIVFEELETALADLAYTMIQDDFDIYIPVEYALEIMGDERQLFAAVNLNLLNLKYGNVRFVYDVFKDYFAAIALSSYEITHKLSPPRIGQGGECQPNKWDRPIIILSGLLPEQHVNLIEIAKQNPFLALECLASGLNVSDRLIDPVVGQLIQVANTPENDARVATAKILAKINYDLALPILLEAMRDGQWDVRWAAMLSLQDLEVSMLPGLTEVLEELDYNTQESAYSAIRHLGESALPTLFGLLQHETWKTRRSAAWALGVIKDAAAVPALVQALYDEDNLVSAEAATALAGMHSVDAIPWLVENLNHANWRVRKATAQTLSEIGTAAIPFVLRMLDHQMSRVRRLAVEILVDVDTAEVTSALLQASHDPSADVRGAAISALDGREDGQVVSRLIECLNDTAKTKQNRKRICDIAARILTSMDSSQDLSAVKYGQIATQPIPDSISKDVKAMPANAKGSAATAKDRLKRSSSKNRVAHDPDLPLAEALQHADWRIRLQAIEKATAIEVSSVTAFLLIQSLDDVDVRVRLAALKAIPTDNIEACVNAWQKSLKHHDATFLEASIDYIVSLGKRATPLLIELLKINDSNIRAQSLSLLGRLGDERAVPALINFLSDREMVKAFNQPLSEIAAQSLRQLATPTALDALEAQQTEPNSVPKTVPANANGDHRLILTAILARLHESEWGDKEEAAKALREYAKTMHGIHDPVIIKLLEQALTDSAWIVRWAAAEALAWIGDQTAVPALTKIIRDPNWTVRIAVIRALLEIGDNQASQYILPLLKDNNGTVREAAAEALGFLGNPESVDGLAACLFDTEPLVRLASVVALGKISDLTVVEPLIAALSDEDSHVRWASADAMRHIRSERVVPKLIDRLDDVEGPYWEDKRICDLAAEALTNIGTADAKAALEAWRKKQPMLDE